MFVFEVNPEPVNEVTIVEEKMQAPINSDIEPVNEDEGKSLEPIPVEVEPVVEKKVEEETDPKDVEIMLIDQLKKKKKHVF